jgi:hypothetical protein
MATQKVVGTIYLLSILEIFELSCLVLDPINKNPLIIINIGTELREIDWIIFANHHEIPPK